MLTYFAILSAALLVCAALIQCVVAIGFTHHFRKLGNEFTPPADDQPAAAILMSVRGADPSLIPAVSGALDQTHSNYTVHIVVDHDSDPAWEVLNRLRASLRRGDALQLHLMQPPSKTCGLKCHSLVQAVESLPPEVEHIALLDADVVPHSRWLQTLTAPLQNEAIGGVTGAQWFEPQSNSATASWWRSVWNGGAMIPTIYFANPWAGSFAMRRKDMTVSGLIDAWKRSIVDDGPIRDCLGSLGKKIVFAPSLIMVNRESCEFRYVTRWTTRMLTWSRLHEPTFYLTQLHAAFSNFVLAINVAALLCGIVSLALGYTTSIPVLASLLGLITAGFLCVWAYVSSRTCAQHSCQLRDQLLDPPNAGMYWQVFWAAAPAHWVFGLACWKATWLSRVTWRGISYLIRNKSDIERLDYEPYLPASNDPSHSI